MRKFQIKWTISKAKKTIGYDICSLWEVGHKLYSCKGIGGYDMEGTVVAQWLVANWGTRIEKLYAPNFYGLMFTQGDENLPRFKKGCKIRLDGRYGLSGVRVIASAIGLEMSEHRFGKLIAFFVTDTKGGRK
jgi:hypothetical protein